MILKKIIKKLKKKSLILLELNNRMVSKSKKEKLT